MTPKEKELRRELKKMTKDYKETMGEFVKACEILKRHNLIHELTGSAKNEISPDFKHVTFKKSGDPFKPDEPQPKEYYVSIIRDKEMKKRINNLIKQEEKGIEIYENIFELIMSLSWHSSIEGIDFWAAISRHFNGDNGLKSYEDFKHLDKSVNQK